MYLLVEFFDKEENSVRPLYCLALRLAKSYFKTGALTANLSDNPQKVNGLAGITLGTRVSPTDVEYKYNQILPQHCPEYLNSCHRLYPWPGIYMETCACRHWYVFHVPSDNSSSSVISMHAVGCLYGIHSTCECDAIIHEMGLLISL